jgi:hypothetical protein
MEFGKGLYENHTKNILKMKNDIIEENKIGKGLLPQYVGAAKLTSNNLSVISLIIKIMIGNIIKNKIFSPYVNKLNSQDISLMNSKEETFTELNTLYKMIYDLLDNIGDLARRFLGYYNFVLKDKDYLSREQAKLISRDIDEFLSAYYSLCEEINKENEMSGIYFINDVVTLKDTDVNNPEPQFVIKRVFSKLYPEYFTSFYDEIKKVRKELLF